MAAPQWTGGKVKSIQQAKAMFGHNAIDRRLEARHTNVHINKALTPQNFSYRGLSYQGLCGALDKRLQEVDTGRQSSGKNARVIMQSVIIYPPEGLAGDKAKLKSWFMDAGRVLESKFGNNFLDMQVDFDEVHDYIDPETKEKRTSLEHGHARLVPVVDGKLNGKAFASRKTIRELNTALQEMSLELYGVPMMDGTKKKGGQPVESLKAKSEAAAIVKQAEKDAQRIRLEAQQAADRQRAVLEARSREMDAEEGRRALEWETALEGLRRATKAADDERALAGAIVKWAESNVPKVVDKMRATLHKADAARQTSERVAAAATKKPRTSRELDKTYQAAEEEAQRRKRPGSKQLG